MIFQNGSFFNGKIVELYRAQRYLTSWVENAIKRENLQLSGKIDEKWLRVNASERLAPVNHLLTKMRLAEKFSTNPDDIGGWRYSKIFTILVAEKRFNDVMHDYNEIK